jgi:hypothetical protein
MKQCILVFLALSTSLLANTEPLHVELNIYSNQSFLKKDFDLNQSGEILTKVPATTNLADIKIQVSDMCKANNKSLSSTIKIKDENVENLLQQKTSLQYEIEALLAKNTLLKSLSFKDQNDLQKIDELSNFLGQSLVKNLAQIDKLKKDIEKIDEKLTSIETLLSEYKELKISYTCKNENQKLDVSYSLKDIKYTSFYDINANINNKSITLEKKANVFYKGFENFEVIDINIYSYKFNQNVAPLPFYPKYLTNQKPVPYKKATLNMMADSASREISADNQVVFQELETKSVYKVSGVKLMANENNFLHVDSENINADFKIIIDAYGTDKAYLEATIKSKKNFPAGTAKYYLNSNPIAAKYIQKIQKDVETKLYFGEDEHIQVQKELIETLDDKTFFGDKKVSTLNWKYTITNTKPFSAKVTFVQRVPVSKDASIKVKTLAQPKFDSQSVEGKTQWNFTLEAKKSKTIIFGYEISDSK